jgi:hypothetical protein
MPQMRKTWELILCNKSTDIFNKRHFAVLVWLVGVTRRGKNGGFCLSGCGERHFSPSFV